MTHFLEDAWLKKKEKGTYGEYKDYTSVYLKVRYVF